MTLFPGSLILSRGCGSSRASLEDFPRWDSLCNKIEGRNEVTRCYRGIDAARDFRARAAAAARTFLMERRGGFIYIYMYIP